MSAPMPEPPAMSPSPPRQIQPAVWYTTLEVLQLLGGLTRRQLRRLGIPCTPMARGKDLYLGQDLLDYLTSRGKRRLQVLR